MVKFIKKILKYKKNKSANEFPCFLDILKLLPGHIYWKDIHHVYLGANDELLKTLHLNDLDNLVGKTDYDLLPKVNADYVVKVDKAIMKSGVSRTLEEIGFDSNGQEAIYLTKKTPVRNKQGNVVGLLGISLDVTASKKADEELIEEYRQKEITLESIINLMPGYVYWMDKNGIWRGCNNNELKLLRLKSRDDFVGKHYKEVAKKINLPLDGLMIEKMLKTSCSIVTEEAGINETGRASIYFTNKVSLNDSAGNIVGLLGISIDITDRKRMEDELKKAKECAEIADRAKSQFIENMEHDLRTPSAGISQMTEYLAAIEVDVEKKEILTQLTKASKQLLKMLNDILAFNYIASNRISVVNKRFHVRRLLDDLIAMEMPLAHQKQLKLTVVCSKDVPEILIGDDYRLSRILLNLLSNAVKFTAKGHVKILVNVAEICENKKIWLQFAVEDTGAGVPEDKQKVIYERFVRLLPSNKGLYEGGGLGLSIVQKFVKELNGEMKIKSKVGDGSIFVCRVPFEIAPAETEASNLYRQVDFQNKNLKLRILLVEDDSLSQKGAQIILDHCCHDSSIDTASSGKEAIQYLLNHPYDLIFLDIGLPDVSGYEIAKQARNGSLNKATPIIVLTAHRMQLVKTQCNDLGINHVINKPLDIEKVRFVIADLVSQRA